MSPLLIAAIVSITAALVFYTTGVLSERRRGLLGGKQLAFFWAGLVFDFTGTSLMSAIAQTGTFNAAHAASGALAIALMLLHAAWATVVLVRKNTHSQQTFHRFSSLVWMIWLVPYVMGMMMGMGTQTLSAPILTAIAAGVAVVVGHTGILVTRNPKKA